MVPVFTLQFPYFAVSIYIGDPEANKGKKFGHWRRNGLEQGRRSITPIHKPTIIAHYEINI